MKEERKKLIELILNEKNAREIREYQFEALINSILTMPEMLEIRPIVINEKKIIIDGNMRTRALLHIAQLTEGEIKKRIESNCLDDPEKKYQFWQEWKKDPEVTVLVSDFVPEDEKEFSIRANISFGTFVNNEDFDVNFLKNFHVSLDSVYEGDLDTNKIIEDFDYKHRPKPVLCPRCGKDIYEPKEEKKITKEKALANVF